MIGLLIASTGGAGVYLLWTYDREAPARRSRHLDLARWLDQAGIGNVRLREFVAVSLGMALVGGAAAWAIFGGPVVVLLIAGFAATYPTAAYRNRRRRRLADAAMAWPQLIEEIRLSVTGLGRSIPQALFDAGQSSPDAMRPAFAASHRQWMLGRDFAASCAQLREHLSDPVADATCETLLVAHELGGADLDSRLAALAEDRRVDALDRQDAVAKQAGVRFARRFVLLVPAGMAMAGMAVGPGRSAYGTPLGQVLVASGIAVVIACWFWAGRIMALPTEERAFR